ncbi:similar to Saccharomyces cerevisiae YMR042W ARG80 Transcription factor involved in regulation of arginine-responsive genes [Maudiozyma saulgeensis]|uniref:Similar to Saccharomyces cerevisiae YMR042W ARG80 Transcription factor involved in regulation of arginine-responsive genes n=1 Tax=Maudiozyma saulgeensis TaxID=1789683 RepID=A0A1X7R8G4_9SACH|nr:similar to Saccharomyces cerevisiae YMR042W ARG80 Transcription factor involved in regulation of arginine-responsive genes [Kazachstania saulgeensis]
MGVSNIVMKPEVEKFVTGRLSFERSKDSDIDNDNDDDNDAEGDVEVDGDGDGDEDTTTRRKKPIKYIQNRTRRHVTFAKRRHGIMKKAYELSVLTGANILLLIESHNTGLVYTFTTPRLERVVAGQEGKDLVRRCLAD